MDTTVYDSGEPIREGVHVYCHSRRDGKELLLGKNDELPNLSDITVTGKVGVAPGGCTFIVL